MFLFIAKLVSVCGKSTGKLNMYFTNGISRKSFLNIIYFIIVYIIHLCHSGIIWNYISVIEKLILPLKHSIDATA
jgi:hypothetical protein